MRDPARIDDVLAALSAYWKAHPDLRLCQIIGNFANDRLPVEYQELMTYRGPVELPAPHLSGIVYCAEDDKLLAYLRDQMK